MSLELCDIDVRMGRKPLLRRVSFTLRPGEVVAVLGPNGAGKSSVLKVMAGEHRIDRGALYLNGRDYRRWKPGQIAQVVGVLPQQSLLMFPFSVTEVVGLGRIPHRSGRVRDAEIVQQAMARVDVAPLARALYPTLSGGEKQRVQLARVLAQIWEPTGLGPRYLLLDEPTSALDIAHQHQTLKLARSLAGEAIGVLAVLHDFNLAARYADRIVLMHHGNVVAQGRVEEILTPATLRPVFNVDVDVISHPTLDRPLIVNL